jgi:opacity protein-like surface antigen
VRVESHIERTRASQLKTAVQIYILVVLFSGVSFAATVATAMNHVPEKGVPVQDVPEKGVAERESEAPRKFLPAVMVGTGVLFEKNNDGTTDSTRLPYAFGIGARFQEWQARLEYSMFRTADGNSTVSVSREHEATILWGSFEFANIDRWMPYAALGAGLGRTNVQTRMAGVIDSVSEAWAGLFAVAFGIRTNWATNLGVRPELRYESAESFKTKDARMGVFIQLDYLF